MGSFRHKEGEEEMIKSMTHEMTVFRHILKCEPNLSEVARIDIRKVAHDLANQIMVLMYGEME